MPIRPEQRFFYPIDWAELSAAIRFGRAAGACERCGRPHGREVWHLGSLRIGGRAGLWWDGPAEEPAQPDLWDASGQGVWRCDRGRSLSRRLLPPLGTLRRNPAQLAFWAGLEGHAVPLRRSPVVLACCHLDHDPTNNAAGNLAALCQRCHLAHDFSDNLARRRRHAVAARVEGLTPLPI